MMTNRQYILIKLAEEASELAQRALKQAQFGDDQVQPGHPLTNAQRTREEFLDVLCWARELKDNGSMATVTGNDIAHHTFKKFEIVNKMAELARETGNLE